MKFTTALLSAVCATAATAAPAAVSQDSSSSSSSLDRRATSYCGSFGSSTSGPYTLYQNNWGASSASSGSQCTTFGTLSGSNIAWSTNWTWTGGAGQVKSYSNIALEKVNKQLSSVKSIQSTWKWSQTGSNIIADVSYDLWLSSTSGGTDTYEIMVWLAALGGAGPISATGKAVATTTIGGVKFNLFSGTNGNTKVLSFVADSPATNWSADMNLFFTYLIKNQGVSASSWITHLQAGTEPFSGSGAVLTTSQYSMVVA